MRVFQNRKILFYLSLILLISGCVGVPTVIRNGVEMPIDQAAKLDYEQAEFYYAKKDYKSAQTLYQNIITQLSRSVYADNAMFRLAHLFQMRNQSKNAASLYETIIANYPHGDVFDAAKEQLALLLMQEGGYKRAADLFSTLKWRESSPERRSRLEKSVREAFDKSDSPLLKLKWLVEYYYASDPKKQVDFKTEILDLIEHQVTNEQLESYAGEIRENQFPLDYVLYQLAQSFYHSGKHQAAKKYLSAFINRFPGHERTREAIDLSDRLVRSSQVNPLAIGLLVPMSGDNEIFAQQLLQGAALAMNAFSSTPQEKPIQLYIEDSGENPDQALQAMENLISKYHVIAVAGPMYSRQSQAAAQAASEMGLPMISMSAAEGVTNIGPTVFRNSLTKSEQALNLAYLAKDILGIKRAAILYPDNNYGQEFMRFFWEEYTARGGEIRAVESYSPESRGITLAVKKMVGLYPYALRQDEICKKEDEKDWQEKGCYPYDKLPPLTDFEAVFIPDNYEAAQQIAPTLAYFDIRGVQILGPNLWNAPDILSGGAGDYLQGALFLDGFWKNRKTAPVPEFVQKFYSQMGKEPGVFEAFAYDTVSLLKYVIENSHPNSRESFAKALERVRDFPGVTGAISIKSNRDAVRRLSVLTIDNNQITELE